MNAGWQDTPAAVLLRLLADLMMLNVLLLVCSIPVVTIGAGLSAMYAVLFKREEAEDGTIAVLRNFFAAFKRNFWKATALEAIVAVLLTFTVGDFWFAVGVQGLFQTVYTVLGTVTVVLALALFVLAFSQQSIYQNSILGYLKNSAKLAVCAPGQLILALLVWILPWCLPFVDAEVFLYLGVAYLLFGFSLPAWVTVKLLRGVFQKTRQTEEEA